MFMMLIVPIPFGVKRKIFTYVPPLRAHDQAEPQSGPEKEDQVLDNSLRQKQSVPTDSFRKIR